MNAQQQQKKMNKKRKEREEEVEVVGAAAVIAGKIGEGKERKSQRNDIKLVEIEVKSLLWVPLP